MIFYESYYRAIQRLSPEERLEAYETLCGFGCEGKVPPDDLPPNIGIIWDMAYPLMCADNEKKSTNKGGRPPKASKISNKFMNFTPSDIDYNEIERKLVNR